VSDHPNFPFADVALQMDECVRRGETVHQKFTCGSCGSRQTMATPNTMWTSGRCEECGAVTDIRAAGCNFLRIVTGGQRGNEESSH
jgi:hypothetical protein